VYFEDQLKLHSKNTRYCGVLEPEKIYTTLSQYDLMLFPTLYYTEGFPGSVLDAYISGIPVIASDWKYSKEFVREGVSGFICPMNDVDAFCTRIEHLDGNRDQLYRLRLGVLTESKKYSPETAWDIIKWYL
jgi:glycosyltransferase involved in cell wall biosynthesis